MIKQREVEIICKDGIIFVYYAKKYEACKPLACKFDELIFSLLDVLNFLEANNNLIIINVKRIGKR